MRAGSGRVGDNTFFKYGIKIASGACNRIVDNDIVGGQDGNAIGIQAQATDKGYYNDLHADYPPPTCNASNGNY